MALVVALAYNQHDVRRFVRATVDFGVNSGLNYAFESFFCLFRRVIGENHPVQRCRHLAVILPENQPLGLLNVVFRAEKLRISVKRSDFKNYTESNDKSNNNY